MSKPVLVIGAGGHASVLVDMLRQLNHTIVGLVSTVKPANKPVFADIPHYASDDDVFTFEKDKVLLANGIGSLPGKNIRTQIHRKFKQSGYHFITVVSPHAIVSEYSSLAEGVQVMPGAIVNANSVIGEGTIINSGAIVEHDCYIGDHNHIAPGVSLSGGVVSGQNVHIGTGANVIHSITIGQNVMISAGSTVSVNLADNSKHYVAKPYIC